MRNVPAVLGIVILVVLLVLVLGAGVVAMGRLGMMGPGMLGYGGMMRGYLLPLSGIRPLWTMIPLASCALLVGGLVLVILWLARSSKPSPLPFTSSPTPLDILKARYARGEITKEQFEGMKRDVV